MPLPFAKLRDRHRRLAIVATIIVVVAACGPAETTGASPGDTPTTSAAPSNAAASASVPASSPSLANPSGATTPVTELGGRLLATIDGIAKPCAMVATATDVWVTGNGPSMLARIDPATNEIVSQSPMDGSPCGIAVGPDGRLWVALLTAGLVVAVDPATAAVDATLDGFGPSLWDLKAGFDAIWVVDRSRREVVRIDPTTETVMSRIPIGPSGSGLAIAGGAVWVVDDVDASVRRIDPATNAVTATAELRRGSSWFTNDGEALLVANRLDGSITPIDAIDGGTGVPIEGSRSPLDGTVAGERAYIPDGQARTLVEVDLERLAISAVSRLEGARNPFVAEIAFDDLWVLDYGGERLWRIAP